MSNKPKKLTNFLKIGVILLLISGIFLLYRGIQANRLYRFQKTSQELRQEIDRLKAQQQKQELEDIQLSKQQKLI